MSCTTYNDNTKIPPNTSIIVPLTVDVSTDLGKEYLITFNVRMSSYAQYELLDGMEYDIISHLLEECLPSKFEIESLPYSEDGILKDDSTKHIHLDLTKTSLKWTKTDVSGERHYDVDGYITSKFTTDEIQHYIEKANDSDSSYSSSSDNDEESEKETKIVEPKTVLPTLAPSDFSFYDETVTRYVLKRPSGTDVNDLIKRRRKDE